MLFQEKPSLVWELKTYPFGKNLFKKQQNTVKLTLVTLKICFNYFADLPAGYQLL